MGDESSGLHCVLPAHGGRVGPMWIPVGLSADLRVLFIDAADVTVVRFKVEHCQTGRFVQRSLLTDAPFASYRIYRVIYSKFRCVYTTAVQLPLFTRVTLC